MSGAAKEEELATVETPVVVGSVTQPIAWMRPNYHGEPGSVAMGPCDFREGWRRPSDTTGWLPLYARVTAEPLHSGGGSALEDHNLLSERNRLREALEAYVAWMDHEAGRPDYPEGITRDNGGEAIWEAWWHRGLDLCRTAEDKAREALGAKQL